MSDLMLPCRGCGVATSTGLCERCWGRGNDPWASELTLPAKKEARP